MNEIFGGSQSQYESSTTPQDMLPAAFRRLRGPFARSLRTALGSVDLPGILNSQGVSQEQAQHWQDTLAVPETANEQALRALLMQDAAGASGRQGLIERTIAGDFLGSNPHLTAAIEAAQRPTLQGLEETLSRALPGRFTQAGQFVQPRGSSAFDRAAAIATRGAADALSDIATNMSFAGYEAERGRQQEAVQLSQQEVETTIQNLQAQALPRLIQQYGIDQGLKEYQGRVQAVLEVLRTIAGVTAPVVASRSQSSGTSESSTGIIPALGSMFSFSVSR